MNTTSLNSGYSHHVLGVLHRKQEEEKKRKDRRLKRHKFWRNVGKFFTNSPGFVLSFLWYRISTLSFTGFEKAPLAGKKIELYVEDSFGEWITYKTIFVTKDAGFLRRIVGFTPNKHVYRGSTIHHCCFKNNQYFFKTRRSRYRAVVGSHAYTTDWWEATTPVKKTKTKD